MTPTREQVYAAAFAKAETLLVANGGAFNFMSRRLQFVEEVPSENFPHLFQFQMNQEPLLHSLSGPVGWWLDLEWYVGVEQPDTNLPSTPVLNPRIDDVCDLLTVDPSEPTTLTFEAGGEEFNCAMWINGTIQVWEGLLGNRAVAIIPIRVQVPYT